MFCTVGRESPSSDCKTCKSCTTPLIIGVVVGLVGILVGGSGLIVAGVTVKKQRYDLNPSNSSVFSHCPVSTQSIVC